VKPAGPSPLDQELLQAARRGDNDSVERLLRQGAHVDAKDENDWRKATALSLAADYGHMETAKLLLAHGADPAAAHLQNEQDLIDAATEGMSTRVALILDRGASRDTVHKAMFEFAGFALPIIKIKGPLPLPPGVASSEKLEPIHHDEEETVKLLLAHGARLEARDGPGDTPLIRAASLGHNSAVRIFLKHGARLEARDDFGMTALIAAACECAIIDMPETTEGMKFLLQKGADVEARDKGGRTALIAAAQAGRTENMRLLLDHRADVNARDNDGNTPLLLSAGAGYASPAAVIYTVEPIKLLLSRGANVEDRDHNGNTPLMLASSGEGYESTATVKLLLNQGAEPSARNNKGQTALDIARMHHRTKIAGLLSKAAHRNPGPSAP